LATVDAGALTAWRVTLQYPPLIAEIPPATFGASPHGLLVSTAWSYACSTSADPITDAFSLTTADCVLATLPDNRSADLGFEPASLPGAVPWERTYYGLFTADFQPASAPAALVSFAHGEDKNEAWLLPDGGIVCYQNDINTNVACSACASGDVDGGGYVDCFAAYNAFVSVAVSQLADGGFGPFVNQGPVVWPASGYTDGGSKTSYGVRQPSAIVAPDLVDKLAGDFFYIYYVDESLTSPGTKLARAAVLPSGAPGPFVSWTGADFDTLALPVGFSPANAAAFFAQPGPPSAAVVPDNTIRVGVAHLTDLSAPTYLAVEELYDAASTWRIELRASHDLVHFGPAVDLAELAQPLGVGAATLRYPLFLSADATSNTEIQASGFYLIGSDQTVFPGLINQVFVAVTVR